MDNACAENAIPLLFENVTLSNRYKLWLFTAHCPWQPKSVMVKHQKLWKGLSRKWDLSTLRLYDEVMSESEEGIRFAGVGEVAQDGFLTSILLMREEPSSFLILSERDNISAEMKSSLTLTSLFFLLIRNQNLQLIG